MEEMQKDCRRPTGTWEGRTTQEAVVEAIPAMRSCVSLCTLRSVFPAIGLKTNRWQAALLIGGCLQLRQPAGDRPDLFVGGWIITLGWGVEGGMHEFRLFGSPFTGKNLRRFFEEFVFWFTG